MNQDTTIEETNTGTHPSIHTAITIHHLDRGAFSDDETYAYVKHDIQMGEKEVTKQFFEQKYKPAETVLYTTDLETAFHMAQGIIVNETQNARHMVPSAHPTNVFERIPDTRTLDSGNTTNSYHLVENIGFSELNF